jgi:RNA polymerase sigma factor (TIGR02999 family)
VWPRRPFPILVGAMADGEVTLLLRDLRAGDARALDRLVPLVYDELRRLARGRLGSRPATISTTELVHEAYLKLVASERLALEDRRHFYAVAATAMRQVLVDRARRRTAGKRGGGAVHVELGEEASPGEPIDDTLSLESAFLRLQEVDARLARVVELRFYAGLPVEEVAQLLEVDPRTVTRDWRKARALMLAMLDGPDGA